MKRSDHPILLFDGVCNLCNRSVQFFIKHDKEGTLKFAPLQSETGKQLLSNSNLNNAYLDSLILIENEKAYDRSSAALRSTKYLNGLWPVFQIFLIIPKFLRNPVYNWIARNRYKWYGKRDQCMIPTPAIKERFLDWPQRH